MGGCAPTHQPDQRRRAPRKERDAPGAILQACGWADAAFRRMAGGHSSHPLYRVKRGDGTRWALRVGPGPALARKATFLRRAARAGVPVPPGPQWCGRPPGPGW